MTYSEDGECITQQSVIIHYITVSAGYPISTLHIRNANMIKCNESLLSHVYVCVCC